MNAEISKTIKASVQIRELLTAIEIWRADFFYNTGIRHAVKILGLGMQIQQYWD